MWVESVPNFSEGRREQVLQHIARAADISGVKVLGMEGDPDHNRAVMTIAGEGQAVVEALFRSAQIAAAEIDLRGHQGTHPRMGSIDVIPIIPLGGTPMAEAVSLAQRLGQRLGEEMGIPVYLYEQSATKPSHRNLADVRRGGFEGLTARLAQDPPDFGPPVPHPSAGAVAVGARAPLIAFNIFLNTQDLTVAQEIARAVRGSNGGLAGVKALAMNTVAQGHVQVSLNLVDYPKSSLPRAVELVRQEATRSGVAIVRTELVGMMPLQALLETAQYYLQQPALSMEQILEWELVSAVSEANPAEDPQFEGRVPGHPKQK
jgi:glutamate formiminotransferase